MKFINELKDISISWLRRYLLPDFTNRLTWLVVSTGLVLTGVTNGLINFLFYLLELVLVNFDKLIDLPIINIEQPLVGLFLVTVGLTHNIAKKFFDDKNNGHAQLDRDILESDRRLYTQFIDLLSSNGESMHFLREHDFGNVYNHRNMQSLETFVNDWGNPEHNFHNEELNDLLVNFYNKSNTFSWMLARYSGPIGNPGMNLFSVVPTAYVNEMEFPEFVSTRINELNELASELFVDHQNMIVRFRDILRI